MRSLFTFTPVRILLGTVAITWLLQASPIVTESNTFNQSTGLYTYQYVVDYPNLTISEFDVYVHGGIPDPVFLPVGHTEPPSWFFEGQISSSLALFGGPHTAISLWGWASFENALGSATFTFSTPFAPISRDYFIFDPTTPNGTIFTGAVIGPDVPDTAGAEPEPATIWMLIVGTAGFVLAKTRKITRPLSHPHEQERQAGKTPRSSRLAGCPRSAATAP